MPIDIFVNTNKESESDLHLSIANFRDLWQALRIEVDYCGSISPEDLEIALRGFKVKSLVRPASQNGNFIDLGRSSQQVTNYYWKLRKLIVEAKELNQDIAWA